MAAIRTVVLSDVRLFREGLRLCLSDAPGIDVVECACYGTEGAATLARHRPDVGLLDLVTVESLPILRLLIDRAPQTRFVVLGVPELEQAILDCAEAGIAGFVTREGSIDDLVAAIQSVVRGEALCSPRMVATLLRRVSILASATRASAVTSLTSREQEVASLLGAGLSNKEIAARLCIELPTVKNHVHHIFEKLGVRRRGEAAAKLRATPALHSDVIP
jgi:two-component system, NarL family, nitrate/nitrite response regulator NarL